MKGVELGHQSGNCSFDAFVENPSPLAQALKILAVSYRLAAKDNYETLEKEFPMYDALYAHFKNKMEKIRV